MSFRCILLALCLSFGCIPATVSAVQAAGESQQAEAPRILVMLRLGPDHFHSGSSYGGEYGDTISQAARLRFASKLAREHGLTLVDNWPMPSIGVDCIVMSVNDGRTAQAAAAELSKVNGVEWSQPINEFEMQSAAISYNDQLSPAQPATSRWHLNSLHRFATGRGQTIAIIDSRIDTTHPDFVGQSIRVEDFVPGTSRSAERHGTGIAGIIAAKANNAVGIVGIAPGAKILGLRACWERAGAGNTVCDSLSLAKAMVFALEHKADVINLSLTGPSDRLLSTLITTGLSRGMTVVAAVDQDHPDQSFPSSLAGVIPVANERLSARRGSVYMAPGLDIPTTEPEGKWGLVNGSSYAAAHVSGLAALLRQLSARHGAGRSAVTALGPHGTIDACAAVARVSALDAGTCRSHN